MLNLSSTLKTNKAQSSNAKRSLLTASAILALTIPQLAMGQNVDGGGGEEEGGGSGNVSPPAEKFSTTPSGVDMRTGRYVYSATDISIGESSESGGLALTRSLTNNVRGHINPFSNFSHNWDIFITEWRYNRFDGRPPRTNPGGGDFRMSVNFGGRSETFEAYQNDNYFEHSSRSSYSVLEYTGGEKDSNSVIYTMTAKDGTIVKFRPMGSGDCSNVYRCAFASEVILPEGTKFDLEYESTGSGLNQTRLRSVTSSRGFALLLEYAGGSMLVNKACVLNLSIAGKPSNNICSSDALATSSYNYVNNGFGQGDPYAVQKLASVTDPNGDTSSFIYGASNAGITMGFVDPGQSEPRIINSFRLRGDNELVLNDIVNRQDFADGTFFIMTYDEAPYQSAGSGGDIDPIPELAGGTYEDAQGNVVSLLYGFPIVPGTFGPIAGGESGFFHRQAPINVGDITYQTTPGPIVVTDSLGREWKSNYCDPAAEAGYPEYIQNRCLVTPYLVSFTDPEGIKTEYVYDGPVTRNITKTTRKAKPGSGIADIVTTATYPGCSIAQRKICTKPLSTTDANGNTTNYTYDLNHGGVLSVKGPAVNGVRPETRYSYVQRYARYKNASGTVIQSPNAMWLLDSERSCTNSNMNANGTCAGGASQLVVTSYDYGPTTGVNNLLVRGTAVTNNGKTLRTCYGYDDYGRRISETQPKGAGGSCS